MVNEEVKPIGIDSTGHKLLTEAVRNMLNSYPALPFGTTIRFEQLDERSGIAFSADNGSLIISEKHSVTGKITRTCSYPFYVVYRASGDLENQKISIQEFLEGIGKWICGEVVEANGDIYVLKLYPELSDGRKITRVTRMNSYGLTPGENGVQDWLMPCTVEYMHIYNK